MRLQNFPLIADKMIKEKIKISGMSCTHCVKSIEEAIKVLPLDSFVVALNILDVEYDETKVTKAEIVAAIEEDGYKVVNN